MSNKRLEYQALCNELVSGAPNKTELQSRLRALVLADKDYARGHITDTLTQALKYLSPTVGWSRERPFSLKVEVLEVKGAPVAIIGASYRPLVGDNTEELNSYFGEELYGLARMKGFGSLVAYVAVNGQLIER